MTGRLESDSVQQALAVLQDGGMSASGQSVSIDELQEWRDQTRQVLADLDKQEAGTVGPEARAFVAGQLEVIEQMIRQATQPA